MADSATPTERERPPEEGIQSRPKPVHAGRMPDVRDAITRHPGLAELNSLQEQPECACPPGSQPPRSEAPMEGSWLGWLSLNLGAVAICLIGLGFLNVFTGIRSPVTLLAVYGSFCFGMILPLTGMVLAMASLPKKRQPSAASVLGFWINGLALGFWLMLFTVGWPFGRWQPWDSNPTVAPYDASDFFRR
jgi:hypothetical protein